MSRFVALRFSSNSFHSSNLLRWLCQLHSLVLAGRYSRAPSLSASMFVNLPMYFSVHLTVRFEFTILKVITGFFISLLFNFQGSVHILGQKITGVFRTRALIVRIILYINQLPLSTPFFEIFKINFNYRLDIINAYIYNMYNNKITPEKLWRE